MAFELTHSNATSGTLTSTRTSAEFAGRADVVFGHRCGEDGRALFAPDATAAERLDRVVVVWTLVNPRVFPVPRTLDSWASRAVLGETAWGRRSQTPVPKRHRLAPVVLTVISAAGVPFLVWGLIVLNPWIAAFGLAVQMAGKMWFLDRMALLYDDVSSAAGEAQPQTGR